MRIETELTAGESKRVMMMIFCRTTMRFVAKLVVLVLSLLLVCSLRLICR